MTERDFSYSVPENPQHLSFFPVTRNVAERIHERVTVNPTEVWCLGSRSMFEEAPELETALIDLGQTLAPEKRDPFSKGAMYTYVMLANQAAQSGKEISMGELSFDAINVTIEELKRTNGIEAMKTELRQHDKEMMSVVDQLREVSSDPESFDLGVVYTYTAFRTQEEVEQMREAFPI